MRIKLLMWKCIKPPRPVNAVFTIPAQKELRVREKMPELTKHKRLPQDTIS